MFKIKPVTGIFDTFMIVCRLQTLNTPHQHHHYSQKIESVRMSLLNNFKQNRGRVRAKN